VALNCAVESCVTNLNWLPLINDICAFWDNFYGSQTGYVRKLHA